MQAIVTALDDPFREYVEEICGELQAVLRPQAFAAVTEPHVTYHVAESYAAEANAALERVAAYVTPFDIETHGLGVFHGETTGIFLHVTRSPKLAALHSRLWSAVEGLARDTRTVYRSETWVPHITVAGASLDEQQLAEANLLLARRDYLWRIPATNLCLTPDATSGSAAWTRWELRG